ncbi:MAG: ABC transporter ATP-binding protein [Bacteroidales bacterium]|nr:ABC transporter ATP-binding protein [Bacteroidales bacterium]
MIPTCPDGNIPVLLFPRFNYLSSKNRDTIPLRHAALAMMLQSDITRKVNSMGREIPVIEVNNLEKSFGQIRAVAGISFSVAEGDVFGVLGPNGSGKSTLFRMLLSLIRPDRGDIKAFGRPLGKNRKNILSGTGSFIETPDFYENLSAYRNLSLLARYSGMKDFTGRIHEVLELVGLKERMNSRVGDFSKGMKQRLGIAQAVLHRPVLLILDEPSAGLDPAGMRDIRELILHLNREEHMTILISSHLLHEIGQIAGRMIIINRGRVIAQGSMDEMTGSIMVPVRFGVDDVEHAKMILRELGKADDDIKTAEGLVVVPCPRDDIPRINQALTAAGVRVFAIQPEQSLEDYFLKIT